MPINSSAMTVIDILDGLRNAFAQINALVPIAQFPGFVGPGAGSTGDGCRTDSAVHKAHIDFHGGVAAAVQICRP